MTIAPSYGELSAMSDAELVRRHDEIAQTTQVGLAWYLDGSARRPMQRQTDTLVRLTWLIALMTLANVVLVAASLFGE